jgi:hypothetical protein
VSTRFATNLVLAVAGGFIVVESQAFSAAVAGWVTLGVALGILTMLGLSQIDGMRGSLQRALDGITGILGIWTVIASVVFTGATLTWLSFAEGIGFTSLAVIGLLVHELKTERVVHSLSVEHHLQAGEHFQAAA